MNGSLARETTQILHGGIWRLGFGFLVIALLFLAACRPEDKGDDQGPLAIIGDYPNVQFGEHVTITAATWTSSFGAIYHILDYLNVGGYVLTQVDPVVNFGDPNAFARFDWVTSGGFLFYCQSTDATTENQLLSVFQDRSSPATGGCGVSDTPPNNFTWTQMN